MAGNQIDNLMLIDLTTGLPRTPETGGTPDLIQSSNDWEWISGASVVIGGNLTVNGTTFTVHSEQVNIRDNHLYLNADYTVVAAQTGGFVVNVLPTATVDTVAATGFVASAGAANATVNTTGAATFSAGDIIQFSGTNNPSNDGLFEVESHAANLLTIRGLGTFANTQDWFQNDFVTDTTVAGTITIVNVNVLRGNSTGDWESYTGATTTGLTYTTITMQGVVDLQEAYIQGNTITTSGGEGDVTFAGTETFVITTGGGVNLDAPFDFDSTSFDVQMTGTNGFSIDGTAASNVSATSGNLTLSTITSGALIGTSAAGIDLNATTTVTIDTADATDASGNDITITAGTSTGGTAAGASIILTPGDGNTTGVAGSVDVTGPNTEGEAIFSLETTGIGGDKIEMYVGDSSPSGSVTALAGSLFFRDTGAGAELWLNTSAGSGTTWTQLSTAAGATLQSAYEAGNTITTSGAEGNVTINGTEDFLVGGSVTVNFDTTDAISLDANVASNFTVDSAPLTLSTTTSGLLSVTSAGILDLDAGDNGAGAGNAVTIDSGDSSGGGGVGGDILLTAGSGNGTATGGTITLLAGGSGAGATGDGADVQLTGGVANSTNGDGGDVTLTTGTGVGTGSAGTITLTGPNTEGQALLSLATTGTGGDTAQLFVGDSSPNGSVTADAGSLFLRDTATDGELWINTSTGSGTVWRQVVTSGAGGALSLQEAYVGGNTIVTSGAEGILDISGTETISLDAGAASNFTVAGANLTLNTTGSGNVILASAGLVDIDSDSSVDILATTTFSIDGTGASNVSATSGSLTLSTITSGSLIGTSAADIDFNATTSFTLDTLDATNASTNDITLTAGSSTAGGADGASIILTPGDGNVAGVAGAVVITGPNDEDEALVTLTTAGVAGDSVGLFVGDNDPSATITADAGSLFFRDTGTGAELYLNTSTGSGTSWTALSTGGLVTLQNAYVNGPTVTTSGGEGNVTFTGTEDFIVTLSDMLVDTTASISLDADTASNFTVAGASLTLSTTGSGTVDITSADDIQVTFETNNATAMVIDDGTNNFITFDSTTSDLAVEINQFLDLTGAGSGVTLTAGATIAIGDIVSLNSAGNVILADSDTGTDEDAYAIGIAATAAISTNPVRVFTSSGDLVPVNFSVAPGAATNGSVVFVSATGGEGTITAPTGGGNVLFKIGILQGADGADTTPLVLVQPQFLAKRP